jgi:hypothetical protein
VRKLSKIYLAKILNIGCYDHFTPRLAQWRCREYGMDKLVCTQCKEHMERYDKETNASY